MIEVLSPSNKRYGPDREQYLMKRSTMMFSTASIVEIDLLRGGPRLPINDLPACDYCVMVFRKSNSPKVETWPIGLREELPVIPIPLKGDFADATLDLQALLNRVYDTAAYEDFLYESPPILHCMNWIRNGPSRSSHPDSQCRRMFWFDTPLTDKGQNA